MIIPTFNEASELPATLRTTRRVLGSDVEIIVVDGGSTDGTREAAAGASDLLVTERGRGHQMNRGAAEATGDVLVFLHADTRLTDGAHQAIERALDRRGVVGGCFQIALRGPTAGSPVARLLTRCINLRSRLFSTATGDQTIFARRSAFECVGGFPDEGPFEDVRFYRELRKQGAVVLLDPPVRTSDRRWRERGYARTIAVHVLLRLLYALRVSPVRLAALYRLLG